MQYPTGGTAAAVFHDLNNEQAHGDTCVICNTDFHLSGIHAEPVGVSATTGETVHACPPCVAAARRMSLRERYAQALAEKFTQPKRGKATEATDWEEPILDTLADRVDKPMSVFFRSGDGRMSFRSVTPREVVEALDVVRDEEVERWHDVIAATQRRADRLRNERDALKAAIETDGFTAELAERTVVVTCPDNDRGGIRQPELGWDERAKDAHPTLHDIEGPLINGCIAMHWRYSDASDAELLARSLDIVTAESSTARTPGDAEVATR